MRSKVLIRRMCDWCATDVRLDVRAHSWLRLSSLAVITSYGYQLGLAIPDLLIDCHTGQHTIDWDSEALTLFETICWPTSVTDVSYVLWFAFSCKCCAETYWNTDLCTACGVSGVCVQWQPCHHCPELVSYDDYSCTDVLPMHHWDARITPFSSHPMLYSTFLRLDIYYLTFR